MTRRWIVMAMTMVAGVALAAEEPIMAKVTSRAWRSELYPVDWTSGQCDAQGRRLQDFSGAGYRAGQSPVPENPPGRRFDATQDPYSADRTGRTDATAAIQKALDDAAKAGGVVLLPAGTYRLRPRGPAEPGILRIAGAGVVLCGEGEKSRLLVTEPNLRGQSVLFVAPSRYYGWMYDRCDANPLAQDIAAPTAIIPVAALTYRELPEWSRKLFEPTRPVPPEDQALYKPGDWIIIRNDVTAEFIAEHGMRGVWPPSMWPQLYYRRIVAIDTAAKTLTVDAPVRYPLKRRDNARVCRVVPHIEEVGVMNLSIGMRENPKPGLDAQDYRTPGTAAYEVHLATAITFNNVVNGWILNVTTFRPDENRTDVHLLSNGIALTQCRWISVAGCALKNPQYRGGGGNGYLYSFSGNDCLVTRCIAENGRHNFTFETMAANGCVLHRCTAIRGSEPSDFHMHMSIACLVDNLTLVGESLHASLRPKSEDHGHGCTECVLWNIRGKDEPPPLGYLVKSSQAGWGYVIGTSGPVNKVWADDPEAARPKDFIEGEGRGDTLEPQSLYEDQLQRAGRRPLPAPQVKE